MILDPRALNQQNVIQFVFRDRLFDDVLVLLGNIGLFMTCGVDRCLPLDTSSTQSRAGLLMDFLYRRPLVVDSRVGDRTLDQRTAGNMLIIENNIDDQ